MKRFLWYLITIIATLFVVWIGISYIEVLSKNTEFIPTYHAWNFFEIVFR